MKKIFYYFLLLNLILLTACQVETSGTSLHSLFDINNFLEKEMESISNLKSIKKKVSVNGEVNEKTLTSFDLKKDLEFFRNSNINRIAWLEKYRMDSILNDANQLEEMKYTALDEKLKTRELIVSYQSGKVKSIFIKNSSSNQVSSLKQELKYFSGKGYQVESNQKVTLSKDQSLKIDVEYLDLN